MIREVKIQNYKSIESLDLELGRINVLIGENGCGKTNILEAIALASAAYSNKLDNEFLVSRGIRVTEPWLMRSAFDKDNLVKDIEVKIILNDSKSYPFILKHDNQIYSRWKQSNPHKIQNYTEEQLKYLIENIEKSRMLLDKAYSKQIEELTIYQREMEIKKNQILFEQGQGSLNYKEFEEVTKKIKETKKEVIEKRFEINRNADAEISELESQKKTRIEDLRNGYNQEREMFEKLSFLLKFLVFLPNNSSLRIFEEEGQIQPLGIRGEGLFKFLRFLDMKEDKTRFNEIKERLRLISWFKDFEIPRDLFETERKIHITDKYLDPDLKYFDQRSSNEGFLLTLFYLALFVGEETPKFFAIDNIDNSLNPRLCRRLLQELIELAKKYDKQTILTTHNPAVLDGLDLEDDEQRLFVVYRNKFGYTKVRRVSPPKAIAGQKPVRLSEAFLRGYIGGLPKNF
ncbi:MAG: AAA family ATPase [Spirulina sp.]